MRLCRGLRRRWQDERREFLRGVVEALPYAIHTVLTGNGRAFADLPQNRNGPTRQCLGVHSFAKHLKALR